MTLIPLPRFFLSTSTHQSSTLLLARPYNHPWTWMLFRYMVFRESPAKGVYTQSSSHKATQLMLRFFVLRVNDFVLGSTMDSSPAYETTLPIMQRMKYGTSWYTAWSRLVTRRPSESIKRLITKALEWEHLGCPTNQRNQATYTVLPPETRSYTIPVTIIHMFEIRVLHLFFVSSNTK